MTVWSFDGLYLDFDFIFPDGVFLKVRPDKQETLIPMDALLHAQYNHAHISDYIWSVKKTQTLGQLSHICVEPFLNAEYCSAHTRKAMPTRKYISGSKIHRSECTQLCRVYSLGLENTTLLKTL